MKPLAAQITPFIQRQVEEEEEEEIRTKGISVSAAKVTPDFESRISSVRGSGQQLPEQDRSFMEKRFGADFKSVRIHTDSQSAHMNRELKAQAFTFGKDIYFGAGRYSPGTSAGKSLLAHELVHTIQQERPQLSKLNASFSEVSHNRHVRTYPIDMLQRQPVKTEPECKPPSAETAPYTLYGLWPEHSLLITGHDRKDPYFAGKKYFYEDKIFFDYDCARIDDYSEREKIQLWNKRASEPARIATEGSLRLILEGNASPEGNRAYNITLAQRRIDAVEGLLDTSAINVKKENKFRSKKEHGVDFRKDRSVDLVELEPTGKPKISFEHPQPCNEIYPLAKAARDSAKDEKIPTARRELNHSLNSTDERAVKTRKIVSAHFRKSDNGTIQTILGSLEQIREVLDELFTSDGKPNEERLTCQESLLGGCEQSTAYVIGPECKKLTLCRKPWVFRSGEKPYLLIHEAAHMRLFEGSKVTLAISEQDIAYMWERAYEFIPTEKALKNAASYQLLVAVLNNEQNLYDRYSFPYPDLVTDEAKVFCIPTLLDLARRCLAKAAFWLHQSIEDLEFLNQGYTIPYALIVQRYFGPPTKRVVGGLFGRYYDMWLIMREKQGLIIDCNAVIPCPDGGWWQPGTGRGENALGRKVRFCSDFFDPNPENKRILMIIRWMSRAHPDISDSQVDKYANAAEEFHKAGRRKEPF